MPAGNATQKECEECENTSFLGIEGKKSLAIEGHFGGPSAVQKQGPGIPEGSSGSRPTSCFNLE